MGVVQLSLTGGEGEGVTRQARTSWLHVSVGTATDTALRAPLLCFGAATQAEPLPGLTAGLERRSRAE